MTDGNSNKAAQLVLKSEYSWFVSVAGAIAASALFFGSMCVARGAHFDALCGLAVASLLVVGLAAWHASKRIVFEHDGKVLRGYHLHFGRTTHHFEVALEDVRDLGVEHEGEHAAASVIAILASGERKELDTHFFHVHSHYDERFEALRSWFLNLRYAGAVPAELQAH